MPLELATRLYATLTRGHLPHGSNRKLMFMYTKAKQARRSKSCKQVQERELGIKLADRLKQGKQELTM